MVGIGPQELILVALLALLNFGPTKAASVARDVGRFVQEARHPMEEFRSELRSAGEDRNDRAGGHVGGDRRSGDALRNEDGRRERVTKGTKLAEEGENL